MTLRKTIDRDQSRYYKTKEESEMKQAIERLLFEAYRRNESSSLTKQSKPLLSRWLGLGTAAAYRPILEAGLMVFHDGKIPPPRCMGWLCLTPAGVEAMQSKARQFKEELEMLKKTSYRDSRAAHYPLAGGLTKS